MRTVRISGTVVSASGTPPTNGAVILTAADTDEVGIVTPAAGQIQANGAFTIVNAVPGSYVLSVRTAGDGGGRGQGPLAGLRDGTGEVGILPIAVGSEDMTGVTIVTTQRRVDRRHGRLRGRRHAPAPRHVAGGRTSDSRVAQRLAGRASQSPVAANGTFTLSSLVGAMTFRVEGLPQQWVLKSVEAGGSDVTDSAARPQGHRAADRRPHHADRQDHRDQRHGHAGRRGGEGLLGDRLRRRSEQVEPSRPATCGRPEATTQGNFSIRGLPPTGYLAVAVSHLEEGEAQDPEFLARLREQASSVSLREGETKTVELRVLER